MRTRLVSAALLLTSLSFHHHPVWAADSPGTRIKDKWALVVGVNEFKIPGMNLRYASSDARSFAAYLTKDAGFKEDHVRVLTDAEATRMNIMKALGETWLPRVVDPDDLVVVYIGSHGSSSRMDIVGVNYILTHDTLPGSLYATAIASQDLARIIRSRIPAKNLVIILDTCFSGSADLDDAGKYSVRGFDSDELFHGTGQVVLSSSSNNQPSLEFPKYKAGLFTHHLIDGLGSQGHKTTLMQAFEHAQTMVRLDSEKISAGRFSQTPVMKFKDGMENLQLAAAGTSPHDGVIAGRTDPPPIEAELARGVSWAELMDRGDAQYHAGKFKEAELTYLQAIKLADVAFGDTDSRLATSLTSLGNILDATGRADEAEAMTLRALSIAKQSVGPKHAFVGSTLGNLASIELSKGSYEKAAEYCRQSIEILESRMPKSSALVRSLARLGAIYLYQQKLQEGEECIQKALALSSNVEDAGNRDQDLLASVCHKLGVACRMQRKEDKAEEYFKRSLEDRRRRLPKDSPLIAQTCLAMGMLYNQMNDPAKAIPILTEAVSIMKDKQVSMCPLAMSMLGVAYAQEKSTTKAKEQFESAAEMLEHRKSALDDDCAAVLAEYGKFLLEEKNYAGAAVQLKRSVKIKEQLGLADTFDGAWLKLLLAKALRESGDLPEAQRYCLDGMQLVKKLRGTDSHHYGWSLVAHSIILAKMGKTTEARKEEEEGNRIIKEYERIHGNKQR